MARIKKDKKTRYKLVGGPYDGEKIDLTRDQTLEFKVTSFSGRSGRYIPHEEYAKKLIWEFV